MKFDSGEEAELARKRGGRLRRSAVKGGENARGMKEEEAEGG